MKTTTFSHPAPESCVTVANSSKCLIRKVLLAAGALSLSACIHHQNTRFQAVDAYSGRPVSGARFTSFQVDGYTVKPSDFGQPLRYEPAPHWTTSNSWGMTELMVPLGHGIGVSGAIPSIRRLDPNDYSFTTVNVNKRGYKVATISKSNCGWKQAGEYSLYQEPIIIYLYPN